MSTRPLLAGAGAITLLGCAGSLPAPPLGDGERRGEEPVVVLTMPPPGNIEIVPPRPKGMARAVWIDGEWTWTGRRWVWQEHGWEEAPRGQVYELPITTRLVDGRIVHFPGKWKTPDPPAR